MTHSNVAINTMQLELVCLSEKLLKYSSQNEETVSGWNFMTTKDWQTWTDEPHDNTEWPQWRMEECKNADKL